MVMMEFECDDTLENVTYPDDQYMIYIVGSCKRDCREKSGEVYGDGIYHGSSSICGAAIHSGVLKYQND